MSGAPLTVVKIHTSYNDGYALAVHGEPLTEDVQGAARAGYRAACQDIEKWRTSGEPLPAYIDPAKVKSPVPPTYLSDQGYAKSRPTRCPACRQAATEEVGDRELSLYAETQDRRCQHCGSEWVEVWECIGYCELVDRRV